MQDLDAGSVSFVPSSDSVRWSAFGSVAKRLAVHYLSVTLAHVLPSVS